MVEFAQVLILKVSGGHISISQILDNGHCFRPTQHWFISEFSTSNWSPHFPLNCIHVFRNQRGPSCGRSTWPKAAIWYLGQFSEYSQSSESIIVKMGRNEIWIPDGQFRQNWIHSSKWGNEANFVKKNWLSLGVPRRNQCKGERNDADIFVKIGKSKTQSHNCQIKKWRITKIFAIIFLNYFPQLIGALRLRKIQ